MNLKKSYVEKYGYERVVTNRNSPLCYLETDMLKLRDGTSAKIDEKGKEFALIVLNGSITVTGKDFKFEKVGVRKTVFDGVGEAVYVGKDEEFTVTATGGDAKVCIAKAPAEKYIKAQVIRTADIEIKELGKGAYKRTAMRDPHRWTRRRPCTAHRLRGRLSLQTAGSRGRHATAAACRPLAFSMCRDSRTVHRLLRAPAMSLAARSL